MMDEFSKPTTFGAFASAIVLVSRLLARVFGPKEIESRVKDLESICFSPRPNGPTIADTVRSLDRRLEVIEESLGDSRRFHD